MNTTTPLKVKRVGFTEPKQPHDGWLNVEKATRMQLANWYDEPVKYLAMDHFHGRGQNLREVLAVWECEYTPADQRQLVREFRAEIRAELRARDRAKAATRRVECRGQRMVIIIAPDINSCRTSF